MSLPPAPIVTERLWLDRYTEADAAAMVALGDPRVARMTASVTPNWTETEARAWIAARAEPGPKGFGRAIRRRGTDRLIGTVGMGGTPWNFGYMLVPAMWGQGYATEAALAFLTAAYAAMPDLDEIRANAFHDNPASARVLEKCGFVHVGDAMGISPGRVEPCADSLYRLTRHSFEARR